MFGDNATGRLREILLVMRAFDGGQQMRAGWQHTLGLPSQANAALLPAVARVVELPDEARTEILALEDQDTEGLLDWYDRVQAAMSLAHQFETAVDNFKAQFRDEDLVTLRQAAFQVNKAQPDVALAPDDVSRSIDLVNELIAALSTDPDLDPASRGLLVRAATSILDALLQVRVTGTEGVRDALASAVAMWKLVADHAPEKVKFGAVARFERALHDLSSLTTIATGISLSAPAVAAAWTTVSGLLGS